MRAFHLLYKVFYFIAILFLVSCVSEELTRKSGEGLLRLRIESVSGDISLDPKTKAAASIPQTQLTPPNVNEFKVRIIQAGKVIKELPYSAEAIALEAGDYIVEVYSSKSQSLSAFSLDKPDYFIGKGNVTIAPNLSKDLNVTAKWGYAAVYPIIDQSLSGFYKNYSLKVEIEGEPIAQTVNPNPKDKSFPAFYLLADKNVSVFLEGDNNVTSNKRVLLHTFNPVAAATEYNLNVNADPNAGFFDFGLKAKAVHTTNLSGELNGTQVAIEMLTAGIPTSLISNWKASLVNSNGVEVRTYNSGLINGTANMSEINGWPYLPKGDYKLKYSYTINGKQVNNDSKPPIVVSVPAPEFKLVFEPYTSYGKYLKGDVAGANACNNNMIYNLNGSVSIDNSLWSNTNYEKYFIYTFDNGTPERVYSNTLSKGDVTVNERKKYIVKVDVLFDGISKTISSDLHITGLPYKPLNMIQNDWDLSTNAKYVDNELQLSGVSGSGSGIAKLKNNVVNVPKEVNVFIDVISSTYGWPKTTFYVTFDGQDIAHRGGNFENVSFTFNQLWNVSSSFQLKSSYGAAGPWCRVHKVHILYK